MQWYFLDASQQQVPADEGDLAGLVQNGTITREVLLWNETMSDWQSAGDLFPTWFPAPEAVAPQQAAPGQTAAPVVRRPAPKLAGVRKGPSLGMVKRTIHTAHEHADSVGGSGPLPPEQRDLIKDLASFIGVNAGWMKFLGVMNIIVGILNCLTVVGALVGWIPIWLGVLMFKSANSAFSAQINGEQADLEDSLDRVSFFFKLQGILLLIWLIMVAGSVIFFFVSGGMAMMMMMQEGMGEGMEMQMEFPQE